MSGRCRRRRERAAAALSLSLLLLSVPGDPFSGSGSGPRAAEALAGPRRPPPRPSGSIRPPPPLPDTDDPLSLLGLDPAEYRSAPIGRRDVRRAYRRMAQLYHPDSRGRGDVQSAEEHKRANDDFARINAAYERLTEDLHNGVRPGQGGRGRGRRAGARPSGRPGGYTGGYTYGAGYGASASAAAYGYGRPFEGYWKDPPPRRRTTGQGFSQDRSRARARTRSGASRSGSGSRTGRSSPPRASSSASSSYPRGSGVEDWRRAETSPWSPEGAGKRAMEWAEEISRIERKNRQSRRAEGRGGSFGGRGRNRDIDGGSGKRERAGYWGEKEEDRPPVYKNEASIDVRPRIRNTDLAVQEAEREQQALELNYLEGKDRERQLQEEMKRIKEAAKDSGLAEIDAAPFARVPWLAKITPPPDYRHEKSYVPMSDQASNTPSPLAIIDLEQVSAFLGQEGSGNRRLQIDVPEMFAFLKPEGAKKGIKDIFSEEKLRGYASSLKEILPPW